MIVVSSPYSLNLLLLLPPSSSSSSSSLSLRRRSTTISASSSSDTQTLPHSAIRRIADKLRSLGYVPDNSKPPTPTSNPPSSSSGQIFIPLPTHLPKHRVGHTLDASWSTPETPLPQPGSGNAIQRYNVLREEALREKEEERLKRRKEKVPSVADLAIPRGELKRLITVGVGLRQKLKLGKAGITEGIVNSIHERWRASELVKIKCEDICSFNMKRTHDLLEVNFFVYS